MEIKAKEYSEKSKQLINEWVDAHRLPFRDGGLELEHLRAQITNALCNAFKAGKNSNNKLL
jgi:hypothetical protein